jgi:hypothetical protein
MTSSHLKSSDTDLRELDANVSEIFDRLGSEAGLIIPPGSIFRVACQYMPNYGIEITDENQRTIEALSLRSYHSEWDDSDSLNNKLIETAIAKACIEIGNIGLNSLVAKMAVRILLSMAGNGRQFNIMDIGAGTGDTTLALMDEMAETREGMELAEACTFILLEPSKKRLDEARVNLHENSKLKGSVLGSIALDRCKRVGESLEGALANPNPEYGKIDLAISSAALHHMSFPTYLSRLREALADDGVMVIGDWHNNLFTIPLNIINLLRELVKDDKAAEPHLSRLKVLLRTRDEDERHFNQSLSGPQRNANDMFRRYVVNLGHELKPLRGAYKPCFIEALESDEESIRKLEEHGFATDIAELKKFHKGFARIDRNIREAMEGIPVAHVMAIAPDRRRIIQCVGPSWPPPRPPSDRPTPQGTPRPL